MIALDCCLCLSNVQKLQVTGQELIVVVVVVVVFLDHCLLYYDTDLVNLYCFISLPDMI